MTMPSYVIFDHQGKAETYLQGLPAWNWLCEANEPHRVDFVLTDHAILGRANILREFKRFGTRRFFVYPHSARPNIVNDIADEWDGIDAHFIAASGHVEIMRSYGYKKPLHVVGWHLCPINNFQMRETLRTVLFAPIHPRCADVDKDVNRAVFDRLKTIALAGDVLLNVRYYRSLEESGITQIVHPNIKYRRGKLKPDWSQIDEADIVVAHQTFAWLAVARGIPTVMMAEDLPTHLMTDPIRYAKNWDLYKDLLRFPLDILDCGPHETLDMLKRAQKRSKDVDEWKQRMIGFQFDQGQFINTLKGYL